MINKELLEKYADLKVQSKLIDNELSFLKEEVLKQVSNYIVENDGQLPGFEGKGKFSVKKTKLWQYSPVVDMLAEQLEETKAEEKKTGAATFEETESLVFTIEK